MGSNLTSSQNVAKNLSFSQVKVEKKKRDFSDTKEDKNQTLGNTTMTPVKNASFKHSTKDSSSKKPPLRGNQMLPDCLAAYFTDNEFQNAVTES